MSKRPRSASHGSFSRMSRCLFHASTASSPGLSLGSPRSSVASGAGLEPGAPRRRALAQDLRNGHLVMPQSNTICLESWFESLDGLQVVSRLTDKQLWHTDPSVQTMQV